MVGNGDSEDREIAAERERLANVYFMSRRPKSEPTPAPAPEELKRLDEAHIRRAESGVPRSRGRVRELMEQEVTDWKALAHRLRKV